MNAIQLINGLASLYRRNSVKPNAIALTDEQFDQLCDVVAQHEALTKLFDAADEAVRKSHLRPGKFEDVHIHPDLVSTMRHLIELVKYERNHVGEQGGAK